MTRVRGFVLQSSVGTGAQGPLRQGSKFGGDDLAFDVAKRALAENLKQMSLKEPAASRRVTRLLSPTDKNRHAVVQAMKSRPLTDLEQSLETAVNGTVP